MKHAYAPEEPTHKYQLHSTPLDEVIAHQKYRVQVMNIMREHLNQVVDQDSGERE